MKIIKYLTFFFFGAALLLTSSCNVDEPFPEFQEAANMRIIPDNTAINADDPSSAKVVLDFYSENIQDISKVELFLDFFDFSEETTSDKSLLREVDPGSFSNGQLLGVEVTFNDLITALNLKPEDLDALDVITIHNVTTMSDGRVYPTTITVDGGNTTITNVTPNILNSSATTSFTTTIPLIVQCPLEPGFAAGTYMLEQISGPGDPFFGNPVRFTPQEVTLEESGPINREFSATYLTFTDRGPISFIITCGTLLPQISSVGLGCDGSLTWGSGGPSTYTDDTELIINLLENIEGDCGIPANEPLVLKLTKK